ncbi:MAG: FAD-dependent oxidoreductase [Deltaproteobacteria bacterium]|nr:FAD-dependent oxidoreductase [Deltaproteobacteria bacterium]
MERVVTDILVIGGGVAGCMAALQASKYGLRVALVDKGRLGLSGSSCTSGGVSAAPFAHPEMGKEENPDTEEAYYLDTREGGAYVNPPRLVEAMVRESCQVVLETEEVGVAYSKTPDGRFYMTKALGHRYARRCIPIGCGAALMLAMRKEVLQRWVQPLEHLAVTRLLTVDGQVTGACAVHLQTGAQLLIEARAIVLAGGGATSFFPYASANFKTTGDAYALAHQLGLPFANMEFFEFTIIPKAGHTIISSAGVTPFMGRGSRLYNAANERFMERYDPERLERTTRARLVQALYKEMSEGRGPVYNDASHFPEDVWEHFEKTEPDVLHKLKSAGVDYRRGRFEWVPAVHTCLGGIVIDEHGATGVPGLFAAGECTNGVHGANRLSCNAFSEGLVFGRRAGKAAVLFARGQRGPESPKAQVREEAARLQGLQGPGEPASTVLKALRETAWQSVGIVRNGEGIQHGLDRLAELKKARVEATTPAELVQALELGNLLLTGEMVMRAAATRTESRGQHYREDCPPGGDEWRRWVLLTPTGEGVTVSTVPIPE